MRGCCVMSRNISKDDAELKLDHWNEEQNKHRCAQTRRKEIVTTENWCNHWPFTLPTIHPLFIETTDRLTHHQMWLFFYTLAWWNYQKFWLVSLLPYTPSHLSDWSTFSHTYPPCSLIGQFEWAHTALLALWLVSLNEHMLLCEWAHNHSEIQPVIRGCRHITISQGGHGWSGQI